MSGSAHDPVVLAPDSSPTRAAPSDAPANKKTRTDDDAPAHLTGLEWLAIVRTGALGVVVSVAVAIFYVFLIVNGSSTDWPASTI